MTFSVYDENGKLVGEFDTELEAESVKSNLDRQKNAPKMASSSSSGNRHFGGVFGGIAVLFGALFLCINGGRLWMLTQFHTPFNLWPIDTIMAIIHLFVK